jgi:hypothetical protein
MFFASAVDPMLDEARLCEGRASVKYRKLIALLTDRQGVLGDER